MLLEEAMALDWLFEWPRSRELAERARALVAEGGAARPGGAGPARARAARSTASTRTRRRSELLREAGRLAEAVGDEGYEVQVTADLLLGFCCSLLGSSTRRRSASDAVQPLCEEKGDELHLAAMWNNRSCLWIARNDRERFLEDMARVQAYARRLGNAQLERRS